MQSHEVLNHVTAGDMPPKKERAMTNEQRKALTGWLRAGLESAAQAKRTAGGAVTLRRLTGEEYQHTMEDLLGLHVDYTSKLPPDPPSKDGFLNNGETQLMSASQVETYLEVARQSLDKCLIANGTDKSVHFRFTEKKGEKDTHLEGKKSGKLMATSKRGGEPFVGTHDKNDNRYLNHLLLTSVSAGSSSSKKESDTTHEWTYPHRSILPGQELVCGLPEWPTRGELLVRIRAASDGRQALITLVMGYKSSEVVIDSKLVGSALVGDEQVLEFRVRMDSIPVVPQQSKGKFAAELLFIGNNSVSANLSVMSLEILSLPATPNARHSVFAATPEATLRKFVPKAWRRPVTESEIQGLLKLHAKLAESTPATALRDTLAVVLSSANFLYILDHRDGAADTTLTEHELAARMSYLLWGTTPDDELRHLADAGRLRDQLVPQFNRLLNNKLSDRFVRSFVNQWLDLNGLERVAVNPEHFASYSDELKADSVNETYAFFDHVLRRDLPATSLIASDFVTVNDRMARHYGIQNVTGSDFRAVPAPPHRGGLLTQASFLTANANGVDSHPIKRGTWILQRLLNDPPPPPPPNVPVLDEAKAQAKGLTVAQQLAQHRNNPACADCHSKIDPWGLSLENFNAIGQWRIATAKDPIASAAKPPATKKAIKKMGPGSPNSSKAKDVRPATGGQAAEANSSVEELQRRLLTERGADFARAFVSKLLTYSLGRNLDFADAKAVDELTASFKADKYNIRHLLVKIITSNTFQRRN